MRELRERARLREEMDLLGDFRTENRGSPVFEAWLEMPAIASPEGEADASAVEHMHHGDGAGHAVACAGIECVAAPIVRMMGTGDLEVPT